MLYRTISDWDDAYANGPNIPGGDRWPGLWIEPARTFRERLSAEGRAKIDVAYGERPRNRLDLFLPAGNPRGLVVFIHGGYWVRFDKSFWSHLAAGALAHGHAVAMPSYTLCPDVSIGGIVKEVGAAIDHAAAMVEGPIRLSGHSAGGHLASRMVCSDSPLAGATLERIRNTVSISGVHDLRPLMKLALNKDLRLDELQAATESPALLRPRSGIRLCCWVGGNERGEFLRQNALLANIWTGLGASTAVVEEPDAHHFTVIDGLADANHPLTTTLLAGPA